MERATFACGTRVLLIGFLERAMMSWFGYLSGKGGWAAPRLKDASLSDDKLRESYFEVQDMWKHSCELLIIVSMSILCKYACMAKDSL